MCVCRFNVLFRYINRERRKPIQKERAKREWNENAQGMCTVHTHAHTHIVRVLMSQNDSATSDYELIPNRCIQCACLNVCMSVYVCLCASVRLFLRSLVLSFRSCTVFISQYVHYGTTVFAFKFFQLTEYSIFQTVKNSVRFLYSSFFILLQSFSSVYLENEQKICIKCF